MNNKEILNNLIANKFFTIDNFIMEYDEELQKEFKTNYRIKLETENWDHHKVVFFKQRMETYKGSYALEEKVKEELSTLKKRPTNSADHRILKDRYEKYLKTLLSQPTTNQNRVLNETLNEQIRHINKNDIAKAIQTRYKGIKGVDLRILLKALHKLDLFPRGRTDALFYRCCVNDLGNCGTYQGMEKKSFKEGYTQPNGNHIKSDHELRVEDDIKFLKSIIDTK